MNGAGQKFKNGLKMAVPLLLAVLLIWFTLKGQDLGQLKAAILKVNPWILLVGVIVEGMSVVLRAVRYGRLMKFAACPAPFRLMLSSTVIGYLVTNVFPFRLGEIVRPLLIARESGQKFARLLAGVGVERVIDVIGLAFMFGLFLLLAPDLLAQREAAFGSGVIDQLFLKLVDFSRNRMLIAALLAAGILALVTVPLLLLRKRAWLEVHEARPGLVGKLAHSLLHMLESSAVLGRPRVALETAFWTLLINATIVLGANLIALSCGFQLGLAASLLLTVAVSLGYGIPVPGGMGGVQLATFICLWTVLGLGDELQARAAGWVMWAAFVLPMIAWGGFLVWRKGLKLMRVVEEAKAQKSQVKEE